MKTLLLLLTLAPSFAFAAETKLVERTYQVKVNSAAVTCREPLPPNGHNYSVYTNVRFTLPHYDLWMGGVWTNVDEYRADPSYRPCSEFEKLTKPATDLMATVKQTVTESYGLTRGQHTACMRTTREESVLEVAGEHFSSSQSFDVGPLDMSLCR